MEDHWVTFCAANLAVGHLVEAKIFVKKTGHRRNRVLYAAQVIEALSRSSAERERVQFFVQLNRPPFVRDRHSGGGAVLAGSGPMLCFEGAAAPFPQASVCSAISNASSTSIPRYLTVLSSLVWPRSI